MAVVVVMAMIVIMVTMGMGMGYPVVSMSYIIMSMRNFSLVPVIWSPIPSP